MMEAGAKLDHMANQIAAFFRSYPDEEAVAGIHEHIRSPSGRPPCGAISWPGRMQVPPHLDPLVASGTTYSCRQERAPSERRLLALPSSVRSGPATPGEVRRIEAVPNHGPAPERSARIGHPNNAPHPEPDSERPCRRMRPRPPSSATLAPSVRDAAVAWSTLKSASLWISSTSRDCGVSLLINPSSMHLFVALGKRQLRTVIGKLIVPDASQRNWRLRSRILS